MHIYSSNIIQIMQSFIPSINIGKYSSAYVCVCVCVCVCVFVYMCVLIYSYMFMLWVSPSLKGKVEDWITAVLQLYSRGTIWVSQPNLWSPCVFWCAGLRCPGSQSRITRVSAALYRQPQGETRCAASGVALGDISPYAKRACEVCGENYY